VFNGTPDSLRAKSDRAGAVTVGLKGQKRAVGDELTALDSVAEALVLKEDGDGVSLLLRPKKGRDGGPSLAAEVAKLAAGRDWQLSELSTDPGRLEDVFSSITVSETGRKEVAA
jgi:hypothetical protein